MPEYRWFRVMMLRLRTLFNRRRVEWELDDEFEFHIEQLVAIEVAKGLSPKEARFAALRAIGRTEQFKEECRDSRRLNFVDDFLRDLRYAGRSLRRNPGFATLTVLIMALGIGANTAVFSVVNAVLLKPLSYRNPDRIVSLTNPLLTGVIASPLGEKEVSIPNFKDWRDQSSSFEAMAYYQFAEGAVMPGVTAEYAQLAGVSPEFFRIFGVKPIVGRFFSVEEMNSRSPQALMISFAYWQTHFGGDTRVLGQTVRVYDTPLPIVGVLPPNFHFPGKTDLWFPHDETEFMKSRFSQNDFVVGRLKPNVSLEHAQAEMTVIARRLEQQYPKSNNGRTVAVTRIRDEILGDVRPTLYLLWGAVTVVLLIACANTATLLSGKATSRMHEVAVRVALGASKRRIVRQLTTESLLLAAVAGGAGLLLAYLGSKAIVAIAPVDLPGLVETAIDTRVLAFTIGISLVTSLVFGLLPALHASNVDLNDALKQATPRSAISSGMARTRAMIVVAEIALAVVLLSGAGLLTKSFVALQNVGLGFQPENVLVMRATVPATIDAARGFFDDMLPQIASLPGIKAAGATMVPPGHVGSSGGYFIDHMPAQPDWSAAPPLALNIVAPGTFAALGIPVKSGRDFVTGDSVDGPLVAVVNEALVRQSLSGQNPIGRTIFCPFDSFKGMTIIGVVGDVRQRGPSQASMPECYMTYRQHAFNGSTLSIVARTIGDPTALEDTLRRIARGRSPDVPVSFTTMEANVSENVAAPRFRTLLFGIFAGLAVCLAMAGVYGVMAYAVSQRSNEIGLRIALGATTSFVVRLILGQGLALAAAGLAVGLVIAVATTRLLATMLFHVQPNDPIVYLAVAVLLGFVALFASYVPAWRASRIDPLASIRQE